MKRKLVFATNNAHKLKEVAAILGGKVELLGLNDINCHTDIPETAETLERSALLKSSFIYRSYQLDCFADDTGLEMKTLNGAPGVYSARYAEGEGHDAQANIRKLLHELGGKEDRRTQFRTAISLILDGKEYLFEGVIKGEIIEEKRGDSGSGYNLVFKPEGYEQTFAELGNEAENKISHRALVARKLCEFLQRWLFDIFRTTACLDIDEVSVVKFSQAIPQLYDTEFNKRAFVIFRKRLFPCKKNKA